LICSIIVAYAASDQAIGIRGGLPWRLPDDLARFKSMTMGHTLIMGRRTHESLRERTLVGRRLIVLSRSMSNVPENADAIAASLSEALDIAREQFREDEVFLAGGAEVYAEALAEDLVDRMYVTIVEAQVEADTYFPTFDPEGWIIRFRQDHPADERHRFPHTFQILDRQRRPVGES
jgi:dihydrofolate reductase